jgi:signal peptidase I
MTLLAGPARLVRRVLDLLLLALILTTLVGVALGKLVPLAGGQALAVGGGSMEPAIPMGSAVIVTPVAGHDLAVGDVVSLVAGKSNTVFTHRIVRIAEQDGTTLLETRGDANAAADPTLVPAETVIGRVGWTIPFAGYLITLLSLPIGVAFVLGVAIALLACAWLLEALELRETTRRTRVLRKVAVGRPGPVPSAVAAGPALVASGIGGAVAGHVAASGHPMVAAARPATTGWVVPGRVVTAPRRPAGI